MNNYVLLPYQTILDAINGDQPAITKILKHYKYYINSLCIKNVYSEESYSTAQVDDDMVKQLEAKLTIAIFKFKVR